MEAAPEIGLSKSQVLRALILQSYQPRISWGGDSSANDVRDLKRALEQMHKGDRVFGPFDGAAPFRFFALRVSRIPGEYEIRWTRGLRLRPHEELLKLLSSLGILTEVREEALILKSLGWKWSSSFSISQELTSQVLSALFLNLWGAPVPIQIFRESKEFNSVSDPYLQMTLRLVNQCGANLRFHAGLERDSWISQAPMSPLSQRLQLETDASSSWALIACALARGIGLRVPNFFPQSQPDSCFVQEMGQLGVSFRQEARDLLVSGGIKRGGFFNFSQTPDLFPSWAAVCAQTPFAFVWSGLRGLQYKESNRLRKSLELMELMGRAHYLLGDQLILPPQKSFRIKAMHLRFDPESDHRMAFAANCWRAGGGNIEILNPEVVEKSFPNFWSCLKY
jgi:3-phosphoshikimate 1-carboxyvinyltransferase